MWRMSLKMQPLNCQSDVIRSNGCSLGRRVCAPTRWSLRAVGAGWAIFNETELIEHPDDRCESGD